MPKSVNIFKKTCFTVGKQMYDPLIQFIVELSKRANHAIIKPNGRRRSVE